MLFKNDDDADNELPLMTRSDVHNALQTLRSFLQTNAMEETILMLQSVESDIVAKFQSRQTQSSITQ